MKKFAELTMEEFKNIINNSTELRNRFDEHIQNCEFDYLSEKVGFVKGALKDYSIGFFNGKNYMVINNHGEFLECIADYLKWYRNEDIKNQCKKCMDGIMDGTFDAEVEELKDMYIRSEIYPIIEYVEKCSYELYLGEVGKYSEDYLESFMDLVEDYLYDEEERVYYIPKALE